MGLDVQPAAQATATAATTTDEPVPTPTPSEPAHDAAAPDTSWEKYTGQTSSAGVYDPKHVKARLIEVYQPKDGEVGIAYKKYRLPNGLTVILHEDHTNPQTYINIWHKVGSTDENPGYSGFAHLYEHLMFEGTANTNPKEYDAIVESYGGSNNADTSFDRTQYWQTGNSAELETQLWLEAERFGTIGRGISTQSVENQIGAVHNEDLGNDTDPTSIAWKLFFSTFCPENNPYHIDTIGKYEDLQRTTVDDVRNFYERFYAPNNAVLVVAGDFDESQTLAWVEKYFGQLPPGSNLRDKHIPPVHLQENIRVTYKNPKVEVPELWISFPAQPKTEKDSVALSALMDLIDNGAGTVLYDQFIESGLAHSVSAGSAQYDHLGYVRFAFEPRGETSLEQLEDQLNQLIDGLSGNMPSQADIDAYIINTKIGFEQRFERYTNRASVLGELAVGGDKHPGNYEKYLRVLESLTPDDLRRVYERYLYNKPYHALSILPTDEAEDSAVVTPEPPTAKPQAIAPYTKPKHRKSLPTPDPFATRPARVDTTRPVQWPTPWNVTLYNGIPVHGLTDTDSTLVTVDLRINLGWQHLSPEDFGNFNMLGAMLICGTKQRDKAAFLKSLQAIGAVISISNSDETFDLIVKAPKENIGKALVLLNEALTQPSLPEEDFTRIKTARVTNTARFDENPEDVKDNVVNTLLYGPNNPWGSQPSQDIATINATTIEGMQNLLPRLLSGPMEIFVVGNLSADDPSLKSDFAFLQNHTQPTTSPELREQQLAPQTQTTRVRFVPFEGADQTQVSIGYRHDLHAPARDFTANRLGAVNQVLGGGAAGRLYETLRTDQGLVYGAYSSIGVDKDNPGTFEAYYSTPTEKTLQSLTSALTVLQNFHDRGPTPEEWDAVLSDREKSVAMSEAQKDQLSYLRYMIRNDLPNNYQDVFVNDLKSMSVTQAQELAREYFDPTDMQIIIVGNPSVYESLKKLGYPIDTLDNEGNLQSTWMPE